MFSKKIVLVIVVVFLLAGSVFLGILSLRNIVKKQEAQIKVEVNQGHLTEPRETNIDGMPMKTIEEAKKEAEEKNKLEWLAIPEKLEDLKLIEYGLETGMQNQPALGYYKVADMGDGGEIINVFMQPFAPSGNLIIRFKKTEAGEYFLIKKNSDFDESNLVSNAEIDLETNLEALNAPEKLAVNNITFTQLIWLDKMPQEWDKLEKISSTPYGDFYKKITAEDYNLASIAYILKLPDSTAMHYDMTYDFLAGDNSLIATLNDAGQEFKNKKFSAKVIPGCSGIDDFILQSDLTNRLDLIGVSASGGELYTAKDIDDELFKAVYANYKIGRDGLADYNGNPILSYEELIAKKPVIVWLDGLGDYHVYYDSEFASLAECGKPVVYLYPESETRVKVYVGAKVRISEPNYNDGWSVTSYPDGKIINSDGAVYENLYWEGLGQGSYPRITEGRIVKAINIEAELKSDLSALGLNQKETADFMEFWLPKMPKTPYIRLTWLDTAEMNELAPLVISPRPDTLKRVFLDFSGQNTATTNLAPQQLQSFKRTGFTVVEWGGLLLGN